MNVYCIAQATVVSILCWPIMENNMKINICVYVHLNHFAVNPKHRKSTKLQFKKYILKNKKETINLKWDY